MTNAMVISDRGDGNAGFRFSWGLAIAGGVAATAVTFFLLTLGSGFGLLLVHPMAHSDTSVPRFLSGGAIYFFAAQAFGFAVGGYLVGRLLMPPVESTRQEEFQAGAHGLVAWAVTVLTTLVMLSIAVISAAGTGATTAALYGVVASAKTNDSSTAYLVDILFRPVSGVSTPPAVASASDANQSAGAASPSITATPASGEVSARSEAGRILEAGLAQGEKLGADDRTRLVTLVSAQASIPSDQAADRIDRLQADIQAKTKLAADIARKIASYSSLWVAFSLLFGAAVASATAVLARIEDDHEAGLLRINRT